MTPKMLFSPQLIVVLNAQYFKSNSLIKLPPFVQNCIPQPPQKHGAQ